MPELAQPAWLVALVALPALAWLRWRRGPAEHPFRRTAGTALRCLALAAVVLALAGPLTGSRSGQREVVLALDVSGSIDGESAARALEFVNRALGTRHPDTRVGLVVFGADGAVEVLPRTDTQPVRAIASHVEQSGTDIGRAIEVAAGAFGSAGQRRLVLLSDGRETLGDARAAAAVARSIGIGIDTMPLETPHASAEVSVQGISAPARVRVHEPFRVQVTVRSRGAQPADLVVLRNGFVIKEERLALQPGANVTSLVEQADRGGLYEYEAIVNADLDVEQENNRYQAFVQVAGAPRVLHVVDDAGAGRYVREALEAQGFAIDQLPASAIPATMHRLTDYDLVILDNVSGFDLSLAKMELLESYVRDAGGGVINLGGDRSYAAGGYFGTPVEALLPVTMDVKTTVKIPSLAVIFVLDRSGSMGSRSQGEEKITIAKNAALSSIDLLNPLDRVGVLAFDDGQEWIVPPTEVGNRRPIAERLRGLGAGGSTDLVRALDEAVRVMAQQQAKVKHLIVLSDGLTGSDADFSRFAARIAAENITVSSVALGLDANRVLMADLARVGNGRFYYTDNPQNVPRIFISETMVISRNLVVERDTRPVLVHPGEPVAGFAPDAFPVLAGYQRAFARPSAQVILASPDQDPLLAVWHHGLGKSVAFTSDLTGRWGREWVRWSGFSRFIAQTARWAMRRSGTETLEPEFRWHGRSGEMWVDVMDGDERFINGLDLEASVYRPDRATEHLRLEQVAPGRYRGGFAVPREGRYYVSMSGTRGDLRVGPKTFGVAVPYSAEYVDQGVDRRLLSDLASATGGRVLPVAASSVGAVLAPAAQPEADRGRERVWQPLLLAALVLLVLEVAVRRLVLPRPWLEHLRRSARAGEDAEPGYEELRHTIERVRAEHLAALRGGAHYDPDDPSVRARLYLAAGARTRR